MQIFAFVVLCLAAITAAALQYSIVFPRQPYTQALPLLTEADVNRARRLKQHVTAVASVEHNIDHYAELTASADYIETTLRSFGHTPALQTYDIDGHSVRNIEVVREPATPQSNPPCIVIGAHYDSAQGVAGANDNGTGVAAALELAKTFATFQSETHRLRLVFWVNEEAPYGKTPNMGSYRHAEMLKASAENIRGMIALETLGYFSNEAGSQQFPKPFNLVYSNIGNFVAFVGLPGSRSFVREALASFRKHAAFPSIGGVAPGFLEGIDLSDHWAFHQFGVPSLMITDTAPFRNPHYHELTDVPENVDYDSLSRITAGVEKMLRDLLEPEQGAATKS